MREIDFILTFETESLEESERVVTLYLQMKKALGNPDRIVLGLEHERKEVRGAPDLLEVTGKQTYTIHIYKSEKLKRLEE